MREKGGTVYERVTVCDRETVYKRDREKIYISEREKEKQYMIER